MVDLAINSTGDLMFEEKGENQRPQKIRFILSQTSSQKVSMNFTDMDSVAHKTNNYLNVELFIDNDNPKALASVLSEDDALIQLITLKLKTALGELPQRKDFGSKLSLFKHNIISTETIRSLEIYLKNILMEDILSVEVKATPFVSYTDGYTQAVLIEIYSSSNLLLKYNLER